MGRHTTKTNSNLGLSDLAELADPNAYKGITKFNGVGTGRQLAWKTSTQELKSYLTTASSREASIIYGKEILLTPENLDFSTAKLI